MSQTEKLVLVLVAGLIAAIFLVLAFLILPDMWVAAQIFVAVNLALMGIFWGVWWWLRRKRELTGQHASDHEWLMEQAEVDAAERTPTAPAKAGDKGAGPKPSRLNRTDEPIQPTTAEGPKPDPPPCNRERQLELSRERWRDLRGTAFLKFVAEVLEANGGVVVPIVVSPTIGADLVFTWRRQRYSVKVVSSGGRVGNSAVLQALSGQVPHHCTQALVVTNQTFSPAAIELSRAHHVWLVDGRSLEDLIWGRHSLFVGIHPEN